MTAQRLRKMTSVFAADQAGVTAIEYALLAALIFAVIVASVTSVGEAVGALYDDVAQKVADAIQ